MTEEGLEEGSPLEDLHDPGSDPETMLLLAGHFTRVATHTFDLMEHQRDFSHGFPPGRSKSETFAVEIEKPLYSSQGATLQRQTLRLVDPMAGSSVS